MQGKKQELIRNFSIIAHIDHGKSTLADRIIEMTGAVEKRDMEEQLLDNMDIERERGITIKSQAVKMNYTAKDGKTYEFNLIDTPGHVDFNYEVSRSLAACEGAILVVDSTQGVEAQTLANVYLAIDDNLEIVPVINKVDLPNARPDEVKKEIEDIIGIPAMDSPCISAKTGLNVEDVLEKIVTDIPSPSGDIDAELQCLIFDSYYDNYKGALSFVRVKNGSVKPNDEIMFMATGKSFTVTEVGYFGAGCYVPCDHLEAGEVGYIAASVKTVSDLHVGDTITLKNKPAKEALPGYKQANSMVYCGLYPVDGSEYEPLKEALEKLKLNDAALEFEPETSKALGFGFRTGFLGLLHMEITLERIEREFNIDLIATSPSVIYEVTMTDNSTIYIDSPVKMPERQKIKEIKEPYIRTNIFVPSTYIGPIMELCQDKRGTYIAMEYLDATRVNIHYEIPLSEIVYDFFDRLKSVTKGYASFDYEFIGYKKSDLVKMDILLNGEIVDALSVIVHKDFAYNRGRNIVESLRTLIPRQLFEVPIQASIGNKAIARADIKAMRKNVLAKCYGGDVSRKRKLLEKQKEGKKRMKVVGNVEIPQEAFLAVLKVKDD